MPDTPSPAPTKKPRRWLRRLAFAAGTFVVLLAAVYFIATSAFFLKSVILPKASAALNAQITISDASISPFSQVTLRDLKVQTTGAEPLVTAPEVRARYRLSDILHGNINVAEVALSSPTVTIIKNADGTSNLDPFTQPAKPGAKEEKKSAPTRNKSSKPIQLDLGKFALNNATVRLITQHQGGGRDLAELSSVNITLDNLKNGGTGQLNLEADITLDNQPPAPGTNASLQAKLKGNFELGLAQDLNLASVQGTTSLNVPKAGGALADLATLAVTLEADITPTEIKQAALRFQRAGADLGGVRASGTFDLAKSEGTLNVELLPIDQRLLNLVGANRGMDFGRTSIASSHQVTLTQAGKQISAKGQIKVSNLSVTLKDLTIPTVDLQFAYETAADLNQQSAVLRSLTLQGSQNQKPLLLASLSAPLNLAWGKTGSPVGDAALNLAVTNLNFADWKAFAPAINAGGTANATWKITSQQAGKQLEFDLAAQIDHLSAQLGSNQIAETALNLTALGRATDFKQYNLARYQLDIRRRDQPLATLSGSANFDADKQEGDAKLLLDLFLDRLLQAFPQPGLNLTSGRAQLNATLAQRSGAQTAAGSLSLDSLTGRSGERAFTNLATAVSYDVGLKNPQMIDLRRARFTLAPTSRVSTNTLDLTGNLNLANPNALEGALKLTADALDLTPYYDLVAEQPKPTAKPSTPSQTPASQSPPSAPPAGGETEPAAVTLPVKLLTFDANLTRCCLRELEISNVVMSARVEGSRVTLKPVQLTLNGGPISADVDLDLGVPGYQYAVNFSANKLPVEPLANTFSPVYRGQAKGDLLARLAIKGAGITGPSLQKNLAGGGNLVFTNAHIQIVSPRAKALLTPIALVLGVNDLLKSPLNWLAADVKLGEGKINLSQCNVVSEAFTAGTAGEITLASVLTNSPIHNWPVNFALRRSLAERVNFVPKDAPPDSPYVTLPAFAKIAGTIGDPKTRTDKLALLQLGAQAVTALPGNVGKEAGKALDKFGGFLGGPSAANTNTAATNTTPASKLLDLFKGKKK